MNITDEMKQLFPEHELKYGLLKEFGRAGFYLEKGLNRSFIGTNETVVKMWITAKKKELTKERRNRNVTIEVFHFNDNLIVCEFFTIYREGRYNYYYEYSSGSKLKVNGSIITFADKVLTDLEREGYNVVVTKV